MTSRSRTRLYAAATTSYASGAIAFSLHEPELQTSVAPHACPHRPQCATSIRVSTHSPSHTPIPSPHCSEGRVDPHATPDTAAATERAKDEGVISHQRITGAITSTSPTARTV